MQASTYTGAASSDHAATCHRSRGRPKIVERVYGTRLRENQGGV